MAYVGSVGVEISQQAVRPREPARPSPHAAVRSPMMATRQARPRSTVPYGSVASKYVQQVTLYKGQQAKLEKLLKQIGVQLKACRLSMRRNVKNPRAVQAAKMNCLALEKAAVACIKAIKACAGKANLAADAAVATGASLTQVKAAAKSVALSSAKTAAIESKTATVLPSGEIVPGADAQVVSTPVETEASAADAAEDAAVAAEAAGGGVPWVWIGAAAVGGYLLFRRK